MWSVGTQRKCTLAPANLAVEEPASPSTDVSCPWYKPFYWMIPFRKVPHQSIPFSLIFCSNLKSASPLSPAAVLSPLIPPSCVILWLIPPSYFPLLSLLLSSRQKSYKATNLTTLNLVFIQGFIFWETEPEMSFIYIYIYIIHVEFMNIKVQCSFIAPKGRKCNYWLSYFHNSHYILLAPAFA